MTGDEPSRATSPAPTAAVCAAACSSCPACSRVANLFCGWACVVYAMRGEFHTAAPFIGVAIVLDMLDGRIARMTGSSSAFGVEFDSLADLISFGMAPAALTFQWGLRAARPARLGGRASSTWRRRPCGWRGSTSSASPTSATSSACRAHRRPAFPQRRSSSIRTPLTDRGPALLALVMLLVPALLMVSTFRFRSMKTLNLAAPRNPKVLVLVAAWMALMAAYTHEMLWRWPTATSCRRSSSGLSRAGARRRPAPARTPARLRRPPKPPRARPRAAACPPRGRQPHVTVVPAPGALATSIAPPFSSTLRRGDGQPKPGAGGLGGEVGLENPRQRRRVHADAGVGDADPHHAAAVGRGCARASVPRARHRVQRVLDRRW